MIAGHFGLAAAVKSAERKVPLWSLILATVWLDVVFAPLLIAGVERMDTSLGGGYGRNIIYADYTHSLVGAAALAALFGAVAGWRWGRRAGSVLGAVVFSHWLLDLVVHRADMPILPGNLGDLPRLGLGLWRVPAASAAVELALVVIGGVLYWRAARETLREAGDRRTRRAALLGALVLAAGGATLGMDFLA